MTYYTNSEIIDIHIPRWNEIPSLSLYMDQTLQFLKESLPFLAINGQKSFITSTMVNNYVNQGIISPPTNKRYSRKHMAYLIVVCILKQVYSMQEIEQLLNFQYSTYNNERAYDFFCNEFEACFKSLSLHHEVSHTPSDDEGEFAVFMIRNVIMSVASKLYTQNNLHSPNLTIPIKNQNP
ncbi:MAG: DUF1836 domain-containing protein [Erysipelotrichaceae bacterium]